LSVDVCDNYGHGTIDVNCDEGKNVKEVVVACLKTLGRSTRDTKNAQLP